MALHPVRNEMELLRRIASGDERAFSALFRGYYGQISEFLNLLTHSVEWTEEIIQEVFTKIWINREVLTSVKKFDAYLFILCRNHTLNYIRKQATERKKQDRYMRDAEVVEDTLFINEQKDYHEIIEKAIRLLPAQQQKVFMLRQQGFKNPEISKKMNLSIDSVKRYQYMAMKFIADFAKTETFISIILIYGISLLKGL